MKLQRPQLDHRLPQIRTAEVATSPVEQPKRRFDPRIEISEDDWGRIEQELDKFRGVHHWIVSAMAMELVVMFPERKAESWIDDEEWNAARDILKEINDNTWQANLELATSLFFAHPERKAELGLDDEVWNGSKKVLEQKRGGMWQAFSITAKQLVVLFPERKAELGLDDEAWKGMKGELEENRGNNNWHDYLIMAMNLFILFPERKAELELDDEAWGSMKRDMGQYRGVNERNFLERAMCLTILAADEVRITDSGLELVNQNQSDNTSELPARMTV